MTEEQIERRVSRMIDELDRAYLTTAMTADTYQLRMRQIDEWAWMRGWEARLEEARNVIAPTPVRYSYRFCVEYRTRSGRLGTRYVEVVAEDSERAVAACLARVRSWKNVVKVDRATSVGSPIQCSGPTGYQGGEVARHG